MESKQGHIDHELLGRYFSGECSPAENLSVEEWAAASDANRQEFGAWKQIWDQSAKASEGPSFDVEAAWQKVRGRMKPVHRPLWSRIPPVWRVAAVLLVGVGVAFLALRKPSEPAHMDLEWVAFESADAAGEEIKLQDGSLVTLAGGSTLKYALEPGPDGKRHARLQGQAFFEIAPDARHPFIVETPSAFVQVVGTAFNVLASETATDVAVTEGKVRFGDKEGKAEVLLLPGHAAKLRKGEAVITQDSIDTSNALYWMRGRLNYRDRPLGTLAPELAARFGTGLKLANDRIARCRLSATFEQPTIESILKMVAETFSLTLTHDEHGYTLDGQGCD